MFEDVWFLQGAVETVAAKQFFADMGGFLEHDADIIEQLKAWDVYQKASLEARVMHQLSHPNVLGLVGVALHPLSLLVELAPEGDLKHSVERFKRDRVRLSRRTLKCTLIQVCVCVCACAPASLIPSPPPCSTGMPARGGVVGYKHAHFSWHYHRIPNILIKDPWPTLADPVL